VTITEIKKSVAWWQKKWLGALYCEIKHWIIRTSTESLRERMFSPQTRTGEWKRAPAVDIMDLTEELELLNYQRESERSSEKRAFWIEVEDRHWKEDNQRQHKTY
jgi:hypothetical protein